MAAAAAAAMSKQALRALQSRDQPATHQVLSELNGGDEALRREWKREVEERLVADFLRGRSVRHRFSLVAKMKRSEQRSCQCMRHWTALMRRSMVNQSHGGP